MVNRERLENIDIGIALLPEYIEKGYGFEVVMATLNYAEGTL
jgi:RimJ/RimL family protein N-acetyltransferase